MDIWRERSKKWRIRSWNLAWRFISLSKCQKMCRCNTWVSWLMKKKESSWQNLCKFKTLKRWRKISKIRSRQSKKNKPLHMLSMINQCRIRDMHVVWGKKKHTTRGWSQMQVEWTFTRQARTWWIQRRLTKVCRVWFKRSNQISQSLYQSIKLFRSILSLVKLQWNAKLKLRRRLKPQRKLKFKKEWLR